MKPAIPLMLLVALIGVGGVFYWSATAERRNAYQVIAAIENYRSTYGRLPDSNDHEVMKKLGFQLRIGWHPDYKIEGKEVYRVSILEGFDGPYWTYDSASRIWSKDN